MRRFIAVLCGVLIPVSFGKAADEPSTNALRLGIAGLTHGHVNWLLGRSPEAGDIEIVGVAEPNRELAIRLLSKHGIDPARLHTELDEMLDTEKPEAIVIFGNTYAHAEIVEKCAARKLPVMMEKPLATSMEHAQRIRKAAARARIPVLVNFETTWRPNTRELHTIVSEDRIGSLRKAHFHTGHPGPKAIGCAPEFLAWLTDPMLNGGGGALMDFGCYGANIMTWLMDNERPLSVTAVTQNLQPDTYRKVDDEATIILDYGDTQSVIQASWNWPFSRKDVELYGTGGSVTTEEERKLKLRTIDAGTKRYAAELVPGDAFSHFAAVVRGTESPHPLATLENNLIVTEILDAAKASAATGKTVRLGQSGADN